MINHRYLTIHGIGKCDITKTLTYSIVYPEYLAQYNFHLSVKNIHWGDITQAISNSSYTRIQLEMYE